MTQHQSNGTAAHAIVRRRLLQAAGVGAAMVAWPAFGQAFPTKPVRLVVPYPPGGPSDLTARMLAQGLSEAWRQPVVVDNKPGANEIIGANIVAKSPADGYTLLLCSDAAILYNQALYNTLPYSPERDLAAVSRIGTYRMVLVVNPAVPANSLAELVAHVRRNPAKMSYGSAGVGGVTHLPMEWLKLTEKLDITHVPYKGTAAAVQDVVTGNVQMTVGAASAVTQFVANGNLKALAVSGPRRLSVLPQVPTFAEAGFPKLSADFMFAIMAPARTSAAVLTRLSQDMATVINSPFFIDKVIKPTGMEPSAESPRAFMAFLAGERPLAAEKVRASGAKLD